MLSGVTTAATPLPIPIKDRRKVRSRFEERFTARRMAKDYVRVYRGLVRHAAQPGRGTRRPVNRGAHVSGDELVNDVDTHAD